MLAVEDGEALAGALHEHMRPARAAVPLDAVLAGERPEAALGNLAGWEVLVDPELVLPAEPRLVGAATRACRGYGFLWHSASDTWGFDAYEAGAARRRLVLSAGESVVDDGPSLPEESGLALAGDDTEGSLVELCDRLTGIRLTAPETYMAPVRPLRSPGRRRLLRRLS